MRASRASKAKFYHYRECGLPNIFLENGFKKIKTPYGEAVSIESVEGLHKLIGDELVYKKPRLTGAELKFLRKELGLSQRVFGSLAGVQEQTVSLWERGEIDTPESAAIVIRVLYKEEHNPKGKLPQILERLKDLDYREFKLIASEKRGKWAQAA